MSDEQPQRPTTDDREAWKAYWTAEGVMWRTEPEIDEERQQFLAKRRAIKPDIEKAVYPFKDVTPKLTRGDVEWLLSTHDGGRGPVAWESERNKRPEDRCWSLDMRGADLRGLNLTGLPLAVLRAALTIPEVEATTEDIFESTRTRFDDADLTDTDLRGAYLASATAERANFHRANLQDAILANVLARHVRFSEAVVSDANFLNAKLEQASFDKADARRAYFTNAILTNAQFTDTQLQEARFDYTNLEGALFASAHLENARLHGAHLAGPKLYDGAVFRSSDLRGAVFEEAHLESVLFENTHMEGVNLSRAHLEGAVFDGVGTHVKGARLRGANLTGTILSLIHMEEADLVGAHLEGANLARAYIGGSDLRRTFLNAATVLDEVTLVSETNGACLLADVRWRDANLAVVHWEQMTRLGDERLALRNVGEDGKAKDAATRMVQLLSAVRANRQLAAALRAQGLFQHADRFAYRAQVLQRTTLWLHGERVKWLASWILDLLAGYGYIPVRSVVIYLQTILWFTLFYGWATHGMLTFGLAPSQFQHLAWYEALVLSVSSFHGRGFFQPVQSLGDPVAILAAAEAIVGLLIEVSFIATFTQRYFAR